MLRAARISWTSLVCMLHLIQHLLLLLLLIPVLLLHPIRLGKDPIVLLLQLSIATPLVVGNEGPTFIQRVVILGRETLLLTTAARGSGPALLLLLPDQPSCLLIPRVGRYVRIPRLVQSGLLHLSSLFGSRSGEALEQSGGVLLATLGFDGEIVGQFRLALELGRTRERISYCVDSEDHNGRCYSSSQQL